MRILNTAMFGTAITMLSNGEIEHWYLNGRKKTKRANAYNDMLLITLALQDAQGEIDTLKLRWEIRDQALDGKVMLSIYSCDCGHCCSAETRIVDANVDSVVTFMDDVYEWAEGPVSWNIVPAKRWEETVEDVEEINDSFRDHVLEAYEDGHAHVVYM